MFRHGKELAPEELPIQIAAQGREDLLLRVAAQLEQAMPWKDRRPAVFVGTG